MCLLLMAVILAAGAVDLDREGRDPAYVGYDSHAYPGRESADYGMAC